ncbi:MAG TPA: 50S ribosomal protein L6 [Desulfobulbaceae bacterium]|nr:50S ribosomal protein L6 [Desulfobulbaceae bacterium]
MSRIGKKPIKISAGVKCLTEDGVVTISGARGSLTLAVRPGVSVEHDAEEIRVKTLKDAKDIDAYSGLLRTLLNNMVIGVSAGFRKSLLIEGVGYRVASNGNILTFNVGYSSPVDYQLPEGVKAVVDGTNKLTLESMDREMLGLTAAKIRRIRQPEPYKGKGIRYDDEYIQRKVGKSGGKK